MGCAVPDGTNQMIALKAGTAAVELSVKCPYGGVHGVSDGLIRSQVVGFTRPAQSSVQERLKLSLMGSGQVALKLQGSRRGNLRRHTSGRKLQRRSYCKRESSHLLTSHCNYFMEVFVQYTCFQQYRVDQKNSSDLLKVSSVRT